MDFNNFYAEIAAASAVVTAIFTAVLGYATLVLARETKQLSKAASQPNVTVTLEPNQWATNYRDILIENSGNAVAYDIHVDFQPPIETSADFLRDLPIPFTKVSILRPTQALRSTLCTANDVRGKTFSVSISWRRHPNDRARENVRYTLAMSDYAGVSRLGEESPHAKIAKAVEHLRDDWKYVASGQRRIRADVFSSKDRTDEQEQLRQQFEEMELDRRSAQEPNTGSEEGSAAS